MYFQSFSVDQNTFWQRVEKSADSLWFWSCVRNKRTASTNHAALCLVCRDVFSIQRSLLWRVSAAGAAVRLVHTTGNTALPSEVLSDYLWNLLAFFLSEHCLNPVNPILFCCACSAQTLFFRIVQKKREYDNIFF